MADRQRPCVGCLNRERLQYLTLLGISSNPCISTQWLVRKLFINKHVENYEARDLDQLLSLSIVWVTHVFLGCSRYGPQLMQRVHDMAEGIHVGKMPSYKLVSNTEAKKRPNSSDGSKSKRAS
uniref:XRN2-binding (XTBD) domain-containing protein n=1 Tax=Electrophorus electricus TaxID=8005 RepID=A0AAY5EW92_ELEEL